MAYSRIAAVEEGTTSFTMGNKTAIMTVDNIVMLCDDITNVTCSANQTIYKLPRSEMFPSSDMYFIIYTKTQSNNSFSSSRIYITTNGEIKSASSKSSNTTFYLNGFMFHNNKRYYNSTIGNNNQSSMTYPIGRP